MARIPSDKSPLHQKPFRCSFELETRLNRAKGALMLQTGERISDNSFLIRLVELGLESAQQRFNIKID